MDWDFDSEPDDTPKKDALSESRVLDLVDRLAKDVTSSAQLEPSVVMRKLERDLGQSLLSFRSAIYDRLNKKRAQLSPTPKKSIRVKKVEEEEEEEDEEEAPKQTISKIKGNAKPSVAAEIELDDEDEEEEDEDDEEKEDEEEDEEEEEEDDSDGDDDDEYEDEEDKKSKSQSVIKKLNNKTPKAPAKGSAIAPIVPLSVPHNTSSAPSAESAASPGVSKKKSKAKLASSMPLTLPRTLKRGRTMLVQIEDPHFDLSGDIGAIGRLTAIDGRRGSLRNSGIVLDLKGHQFSGTIIPSSSFLVVGFGGKEAKVESIVSDFVQCEHLANLVDGLSGSLVSGSEAALLKFDDVDAPEGPRLLQVLGDRKGGDTDDDGRTAGGSEVMGSDESSVGSGGYVGANSDGEVRSSKPKRKKKTKGMGKAENKMIGSKVSMKRGAKSKTKAKAKKK